MYSVDFGSIIMCQSLNKSKFEYKKITALHHILKLQMISAKKSQTSKLNNSSRPAFFVLVICSSEKVVVT